MNQLNVILYFIYRELLVDHILIKNILIDQLVRLVIIVELI